MAEPDDVEPDDAEPDDAEPADIYLTSGEAQRFLRCSARQLKALRLRGEIPVSWYGAKAHRYPLAGLRDFIERATVPRREAS